jgi:hypothetical protein
MREEEMTLFRKWIVSVGFASIGLCHLSGCVHGLHPGEAGEVWGEEAEWESAADPFYEDEQLDPESIFVFDGEFCPAGARLLTLEEATVHREAICPQLGRWYIVRLADGGSMDGPGYHCGMRSHDDRGLGHSLCVATPSPSHRCYWMENYSGRYEWIPTERLGYRVHTPQHCYALDSCSGGLGHSGGGCYKWSTSEAEPGLSWKQIRSR